MKNEYYIVHTAARAASFLKSGYNCAQSVLLSCHPKFNMDFSSAFKIAGGMGRGMACGEICGAVSGAVMIIGLQYSEIEDFTPNEDAKILTYRKSAAFLQAFKEKHQSVLCRELIDMDFGGVEMRRGISEDQIYFDKCVAYVESAVYLLNEMIY